MVGIHEIHNNDRLINLNVEITLNYRRFEKELAHQDYQK